MASGDNPNGMGKMNIGEEPLLRMLKMQAN